MSGGLYTSLNLVGYSFTILFSYNLFMSSLIRQLYSFEMKFDSEKEKKKKKDKKSLEGLRKKLKKLGAKESDEETAKLGLDDEANTFSKK